MHKAILALAVAATSFGAQCALAEDAARAARKEAAIRASVASPLMEASIIVAQIKNAKKKLVLAVQTNDAAGFNQFVDEPLADTLHRWEIVKERDAKGAEAFRSCGEAAYQFRQYANTFVGAPGVVKMENRARFEKAYGAELRTCQAIISKA